MSVQNGVNKNAMQLDFIFIQTSASSQLTDFEEKRFVVCVDAATQKTAHSRVFYHFFHTLFLFFCRLQRQIEFNDCSCFCVTNSMHLIGLDLCHQFNATHQRHILRNHMNLNNNNIRMYDIRQMDRTTD